METTASANTRSLSAYNQEEPIVRVGIMEAQRIRYIHRGVDHEVCFSSDFSEVWLPEGPFTLCGVTIGKQFHWEQQEDQTFVGALRIISDGHQLVAINEVRLEDYLASVISSEMAATNNLELLKTHAIISRSWVMRQMDARPMCKHEEQQQGKTDSTGAERIVYWDHDDHSLYDVCADDHCQRYQGITRQVSPLVAEAIRQTRGQVLTSPALTEAEGALHICDARFYKACGGHTERFSACWQDRDYHYLTPVADPYCAPEYIAQLPGGMEGVMRQVLNDYDRTTVDYHEWAERYTADELTALVESRLREVFRDAPHLGRITALEPVERGASGRIVRLRIVGTERSLVVGKELLVRKVLSTSHLKSSWLSVERQGDDFVLHGRGWGHGVGLCQIGAAAMSIAGFSHEQILGHYYQDSCVTQIYA